MLTLRFNRRQRGHTACLTLFTWIFALLTGVANACLVHPVASGELRSNFSQSVSMVGGPAGSATQQAAHNHHPADDEHVGHGTDGGRAGCVKFFGDESSAVTKSKAAQADVAVPIFVARIQWQPAARVAAGAQWPPVERPASIGPPLFISLLRLTI